MIKVVKIAVLIDTDAIDGPYPDDFGSHSAQEVMELFSNTKRRRRSQNGMEKVILDAEVADLGEVIPELENSLVNETYCTGEAFQENAVVYSPVAAQTYRSDGCFSAGFGWDSKDLATRYAPLKSTLPPIFEDPHFACTALFIGRHASLPTT